MININIYHVPRMPKNYADFGIFVKFLNMSTICNEDFLLY